MAPVTLSPNADVIANGVHQRFGVRRSRPPQDALSTVGETAGEVVPVML